MFDVLGGFIDGVVCGCCERFLRWIRGGSSGDERSDGPERPKTALERDQERLRRQIAERKARKKG